MSKTTKTYRDEANSSEQEKSSPYFNINILFGAMTLLVVMGTGLLITEVNQWNELITKANSSYDFPKFQSLRMSLFLCPVMMVNKSITLS